MISKENIRKGLDSGLISITSDQGGCCGICCKIGDYAFYFLDFDEDVLLEEFWTKYSKEEVIDMGCHKEQRNSRKERTFRRRAGLL